MEGIKVKTKFHPCSWCNKSFSSTSTFKYHVEHCKEKSKILYQQEKKTKEALLEENEALHDECKKKENSSQVQELKAIVNELKREVNRLVIKVNSNDNIEPIYKYEKEKSVVEEPVPVLSNTIEIESIHQNVSLMNKQLEEQKEKYKTLLTKHTSSLKTHKYIKFKERGPCFYIIEQGTPCECKYNVHRMKFGIAGLSKNKEEPDTIDHRLRSHRTLWPQLKVIFIVFIKDAEVLEKSIKRFYEKEINPNGHEIIEGVSKEQFLKYVYKWMDVMTISEYTIVSDERIKEYNEYVETAV